VLRMASDDRSIIKSDRRVFFKTAIGHGSALLLSKAASAPLDRLKVCLQVLTGAPNVRKAPVSLSSIVRLQGVTSLWRGAGIHMTGITIGAITRLRLLQTSSMWAMPGGDQSYKGVEAYVRRCVSLSSAGTIALLLAYPLDLIYTNVAAGQRPTRKFLRHLTSEHGLLSLYRGLPLCACTVLPFVLVATGVHDCLAPFLLEKQGQAPSVDHNAVKPGELFWLARNAVPVHLYPWNLLVGAASGLVAQTITYPLDTVRRRWQYSCSLPRAQAPQNCMDCARQLHAQGGFRAFYAGYGVNVVKVVPELLVLSGVYLQLTSSGAFI